MKKITLSMLALGFALCTMAQTTAADSTGMKYHHKDHKEKKQEMRQKMAALDLTADQQAQVKDLNKEYGKKMKDLKDQGSLSVDEQKAQRQALVKEHHEKMEAILTPEQQTKAGEMFEKGHKDMGMKGQRLNKMTENLNLSPDQSAKMEALNTTLKTNMKTIRENTNLSQDEKKSQIMNLMKQHKADMEALLTDEQKEQMKSNMKNRTPKVV